MQELNFNFCHIFHIVAENASIWSVIQEINIEYVCILFKGNGKEKASDCSYRTITTCPVIAMAFDQYIVEVAAANANNYNLQFVFTTKSTSTKID